jgi:hypothetical protein
MLERGVNRNWLIYALAIVFFVGFIVVNFQFGFYEPSDNNTTWFEPNSPIAWSNETVVEFFPPVLIKLLSDERSIAAGQNISFYVNCVTWVHTIPSVIIQVCFLSCMPLYVFFINLI